MTLETARWVRAAFAPAHLFVMYGQTEATARLSYLPPEHAQDKEGSIGRPIPGVELRVVDEGGWPLPANQEGYLVARGANVTPGYFRAPKATSSRGRGQPNMTASTAQNRLSARCRSTARKRGRASSFGCGTGVAVAPDTGTSPNPSYSGT